MLSRLVITFLPRSKRLFISWLQSPSALILEPKKRKSDTVSTVSPFISHEVMEPDAMILVFWMLSFKPTFSLSSLTFIKRILSYSSLSAIRVVSSAYLRLLIFLLAILIPACASTSLAFLMMYYHLLKMEIWVELYLKRHQVLTAWRVPLCKHTLPQLGKSVLSSTTWNKASYFDPECWDLKIYALNTLSDILFNELKKTL